jgi:rhamnopyranosyl-N-acetylglucosaminyl-diphospho-decaprenol beta-1,3/1,4-galactofuranosyltransferase
VYRRLDTNTGGSGGFSEGMRIAYELGSTWIWLMDDDVEVIPDGLAKMGKWAPRFKSIQGRRYDYDGSEFYWQYRIAERMGIPIPFAPAGFDESGYKPMNSGSSTATSCARSACPTRGSSSTGTTSCTDGSPRARRSR